MLPFFETIFFPLIKEISFCSSKINNFRTPITIFFLLNALPAVVSVCYTNVSTDNTTIFIAAVVAFVAYVNQGMGVYKGVADYTFSIALFAKSADRNARLLPAHNKVRVMFCHVLCLSVLQGSVGLIQVFNCSRLRWRRWF